MPRSLATIGVSLLSLSGALVIYGYWWPSFQNMAEVTPVLALQDPALYTRDFFIQAQLHSEARYVYQRLIYWLTLTSLPLPSACFLLFTAAFVSFVGALYALARPLSSSQLSAGALAGIALFGPLNTLGQAYLFRPESLPFVLGMGVTSWGIVLAMRERWVTAYLLFGLASLVQFLIGIMPALFLGAMLCRRITARRDYWTPVACAATFGSLVAVTVLPPIVRGELGSAAFDSRTFVELYAFIRNPHHVVPSAFLLPDWIGWGAFWLTGLVSLWCLDGLSAERKRDLTVVLGLVPIWILVNYVFVEIWPSATVAALQLARITPFGKLISALALALLIEQEIKMGSVAFGVALLLLALVGWGAVPLLCAVAVLALAVGTRTQHLLRSYPAVIGIALVAAFCIWCDLPLSLAPHLRVTYGQKLIGVFLLLLPYWFFRMRSQPRLPELMGCLCAVATIYIALAIAGLLNDPVAQVIQARVPLSSVAYYRGFEATAVAEEFAAITPKDTLILVPPSRFEFRFFSRRSVVFDFFAIPFTGSAMREWLERFESMTKNRGPDRSLQVGRDAPWRDLDQTYSSLSSQELLHVARRFGAEYVLTQPAWHPDFPGHVLFRRGGWVVYDTKSVASGEPAQAAP
jgi:hypothetical protein